MKISNLDARSAIGRIGRKTKFQIFPIFIFRVIVIFCDIITQIFDDNSKNINLIIFSLFFPFYTAHSPSSIKGWSKVEGEEGLHILNWENSFFVRNIKFIHKPPCQTLILSESQNKESLTITERYFPLNFFLLKNVHCKVNTRKKNFATHHSQRGY